jgi:uncharacterized membrane protein YidH (DUF202 family)
MENKAKVALVLILGGIACVLASLGAMTYLYHEHAAMLNTPSGHDNPPGFIMFIVAVGLPSFATFVVGAVMLSIGIKIGIRDSSH